LTRDPHKPGAYSPSGVFGDATLATRAKGETVANAMVEGMLREIAELRRTPLP
jgi:creatinine amidohydrolase